MTAAEKDELRAAKRAEAQERLDSLVGEEAWRTWLLARRGLHTYSFTNQVLIALQAAAQASMAADGHPEAPEHPCSAAPSVVKAAWKWKRDGFHPAKGSRGLQIFAYRGRRNKAGVWSCCGMPLNVARCPKCAKADHYFTLAAAFDASQVVSFDTGLPPEVSLPPAEPVTGSWPGELVTGALADWASEELGILVRLGVAPVDGAEGWWKADTRELVVCRTAHPNAELRVLIHELAHALGVTSKDADLQLSYAEAEVAADCVAFVVCGSVGLDVSGTTVPYMAGWGGADASSKVRALGSLIDSAAKRIEDVALAALEHHEQGVSDELHAA